MVGSDEEESGGENRNSSAPGVSRGFKSIEDEESWKNGGRKAVLESKEFASFVNSSSRIIERAISQV